MKRLSRLLGLAGALSISFSAGAQNFVVDPAQSQVKWTGYGVGKSHWGTLSVQSGSLDLEKGALVDGNVVVDMKTIDSKDQQGEWKQKLDGHLKSADFFEVEKYPTAKFELEKVRKTGEDSYELQGTFYIKNQKHPETIPVKLVSQDGKATVTGELVIDRSKYDVRYNSKRFFDIKKLGDKLVKDDVKLEIKLVGEMKS